MTRFEGPAYVATGLNGAVTKDAEYSVWTAQVSGTRLTSILKWDSSPSGGVIKSDDLGRVRFIDPENRDLVYIQDSAGNRWPMASVETFTKMGQAITAAAEAVTEAAAATTAASEADVTAQTAVGTANGAVALAQQALNRAPQEISVAAYGADPNMGVDVTQAVQGAIDAVAATGGGTIFFPPGEYIVANTTPIELRTGVNLSGYGATLRRTVWAGKTTFTTRSTGTVGSGYGTGPSDFTVRGFTLRGNFATGVLATGFGLHSCRNVTFEDLTFIECQSNGGHLFDIGGCEKVRIRRCTFAGQYVLPGQTGSSEVVQLDGSYKGTLSGGTPDEGYTGLFTRDVVVEDCKFLPVTDSAGTVYPSGCPLGSHFVAEGKSYDQIVFRNNYSLDGRTQDASDLDNLDDSNTAFKFGLLKLPCVRNVKITGNTFEQTKARTTRVIAIQGKASGRTAAWEPGSTSGPSGAWAAPVVPADIEIAGNTFIGWKRQTDGTEYDTIRVRGVLATANQAGYARNIRIHDNVFRDSARQLTVDAHVTLIAVAQAKVVSNESESGSSMVYGQDVAQVTVGGNSASDLYVKPVYIQRCSDTTVTGNAFIRPGGGLHLESAVSATMTGNTLREATADGAFIFTGTGSTGINCQGNTATKSGTALDRGVVINNSVSNAIVANNVLSGYTTKVSGTAGSNTVTTGNI